MTTTGSPATAARGDVRPVHSIVAPTTDYSAGVILSDDGSSAISWTRGLPQQPFGYPSYDIHRTDLVTNVTSFVRTELVDVPMAINGDGTVMVTPGLGDTLVAWNAVTGSQLAAISLPGHALDVDLAPDGHKAVVDVFDRQLGHHKVVYADLVAGTVTLVDDGNIGWTRSSISDDGSLIFFTTDDSAITGRATYEFTPVLYDRTAGTYTLYTAPRGMASTFAADMTGDGRYLLFFSNSVGDGGWRYDRSTGQTVNVVMNNVGEIADAYPWAISDDGRFVLLWDNPSYNVGNLLLRDVAMGMTHELGSRPRSSMS